MKLIGLVIIYLTAIEIVIAEETVYCDHDKCSFEGICTFKEEIPTCQCLDKIATGDKCDQMIDYCSLNYCQNGAECLWVDFYKKKTVYSLHFYSSSYSSGYICSCPDYYHGQNCSTNVVSSKKLSKGLRLYYNHLIPINEEKFLIIFLEDQGNVETTLELLAENYFIESFDFPNDNLNKFKSTDNLEEVLIEFGIKSPRSEKDKKGFYVPVKINFVLPGISNMLLTITDADGNTIFYYWSFQIFVYSDSNDCFPIIKEQQWYFYLHFVFILPTYINSHQQSITKKSNESKNRSK